MSLQRYNIDAHNLREAIERIQGDERATLVITGPTCSGKSVLCNTLRAMLPTLSGRIFSPEHMGAPTDGYIELALPAALDQAKTVHRDEVFLNLRGEIQSILDGTRAAHFFFNPPE